MNVSTEPGKQLKFERQFEQCLEVVENTLKIPIMVRNVETVTELKSQSDAG